MQPKFPYADVSPERLLSLAQASLDRIDSTRQRLKREYAARKLRRKYIWFGPVVETVDQAVQRLNDAHRGCLMTRWARIGYMGWADQDMALQAKYNALRAIRDHVPLVSVDVGVLRDLEEISRGRAVT